MMKEIKRPFNAQKALRVACLVLADLILINLSAFLALYIRFEFDFRQLYATTFLRDMLIYAGINSACTILIFHILKLYNSLWEFASVSELVRITLGCFFSAVFFLITPVFFQAIGAAKVSVAISVMREIICLIPIFWLLSRLGLGWTWWAFPLSETISGEFGLVLYLRQIHRWPDV